MILNFCNLRIGKIYLLPYLKFQICTCLFCFEPSLTEKMISEIELISFPRAFL